MLDRIRRQEWRTPDNLFRVLDDEFGFDIDVCATRDNAKCPTYIAPAADGLKTDWFLLTRDLDSMTPCMSAFCNPGFSNMMPWLVQANMLVHLHPCTQAVVLCEAGVSREWWAYARRRAYEIRLLCPRPQYDPPPGISKTSNPREGAAIIWRRTPPHWPGARIWTYQWRAPRWSVTLASAANRESQG